MPQGTCLEALLGKPVKSESILQIRPACREDVAAISELLVREFQLYPLEQPWLTPWIRLGIQTDLQQRLKIQQYACLVAVNAAQEIVGTVEVSYRFPLPWQHDHPPYPYLSNLAVRSTQRQQGIATQLIAASEQLVQHWQGQSLYLHVMANNFAARQLYLKAGYIIHHVSDEWMSWFGAVPRLFLHKRLATGQLRTVIAPS
jgi:ribosomal protein S18 acetylase RimI-like enzyme